MAAGRSAFVSRACGFLLGWFRRGDRHKCAAALGHSEIHLTADGGEDGVIAAYAYALARMEGSAALTDQDVSGEDDFAAKFLEPEATARCVAAVAR
jgi:hypothetical protein